MRRVRKRRSREQLPEGMIVVKIQVSLASTHAVPRALIYNEDRTFMMEDEASEELLKFMGAKKKVFAAVKAVSQNGGVSHNMLAMPWPDQEW